MHLTGRKLRYAQYAIAIRDRELPYRRMSSRPRTVEAPQTNANIPLVVYQAWQDDKVGRTHKLAIEEMHDRNPEFDFVLATNEFQFDFMNTNFAGDDILRVFNGSQNGVMSADIFRYCILHKFGGIYLDYSKQLHNPLKNYLQGSETCVLSHERNLIPPQYDFRGMNDDVLADHLFVQWCLMFAPKHVIIERMISNIVKNAWKYDGQVQSDVKGSLLAFTSSHMWTRTVCEMLPKLESSDFTILEPDYGESIFPLIVGSYARYLFRRHYSNSVDSLILNLDNSRL